MTKFPRLIHVTEETEGDQLWLEVHRRGVLDLEEAGQQVAVYQLVSIGRVKILKSIYGVKPAKRLRPRKATP